MIWHLLFQYFIIFSDSLLCCCYINDSHTEEIWATNECEWEEKKLKWRRKKTQEKIYVMWYKISWCTTIHFQPLFSIICSYPTIFLFIPSSSCAQFIPFQSPSFIEFFLSMPTCISEIQYSQSQFFFLDFLPHEYFC